jgi:hypothetical protein
VVFLLAVVHWNCCHQPLLAHHLPKTNDESMDEKMQQHALQNSLMFTSQCLKTLHAFMKPKSSMIADSNVKCLVELRKIY